ncbi:hypothetical protein SBOR_7259 [Sclerotinia borealis F-4128]|uniref:RNA ligase domain-containing protein n=1 Tax=Sclerotinia borealis (strain F-4128) TaxID=1432307 RepID=W9CBZ3_SCLBF|nr:hypothetical protein SBOR_7259 [Sclerotinia borealis F-4128]
MVSHSNKFSLQYNGFKLFDFGNTTLLYTQLDISGKLATDYLPTTTNRQRIDNMATANNTLYPKISGKPKNLLVEFSKYQRTSKTRRVTSISLTGTVKLHGTHGDILIRTDNTVQLQSRNGEVTTALDSYRFLDFVQAAQTEILDLKERLHARFLKLNPRAKLLDEHPLIIAGEWIGPKIQKDVAVSALPERYFVIISVSINGEWQPDELYSDIENESVCIVNISRGGFFHETILLKDPQPALAKMQALADAVEEECPFAKAFGIIGLGEGIVWKPAAPLCHEAKYWIKLKGPISMGTAVAEPAARMPQRSGFVTPVFGAPTLPSAVANRVVPSKPMGNTIPPRGGFVTPTFSSSTSAAAASRASNRITGNTISLQGLDLGQLPSTPAATSRATKKGKSENLKLTQSNAFTPLVPRVVGGTVSENQEPAQSRPVPLMPTKIAKGNLQTPNNIERIRPIQEVSKKVGDVTPTIAKPMESVKSVPPIPQKIQRTKSEILSLYQNVSPTTVSPVVQRVDEFKPDIAEPTESDKPIPAISEEIKLELSEDQDLGGWLMPYFSKKTDSEQPENTSLSPSSLLEEVEEVISENMKQSSLSVILEEADAGSSEIGIPIYPPLILKKSEEPGMAAARTSACEVVRERRLEQGWQYLGEMGVPTDKNGVEVFLKWLWHDVAVEEKAEIEEMEINRALLKKEIERIGRDWYFEELAFGEHNENFGIGAEC